MTRYYYFQPRGGFNDSLCTISDAINYCSQYNRVLLLDTFNATYKVNWNEFIDFNNQLVVMDKIKIMAICSQPQTVAPAFFQDKLPQIVSGDIKFQLTPEEHNYQYANQVLRRFEGDRPETLLIFSIHGGGDGYTLFKQVAITNVVKQHCIAKWSILPKPYIVVQVRHTDYKCDFQSVYDANKALLHSVPCVYVATDNEDVVKWFHSQGLKVANFTTFNENRKYESLHVNPTVDPHTKMLDLFADIFIITMAQTLFSNSRGGFIDLVRKCHNNQAHTALQFK